MTIHELINIRLNASSVTDMLQYLKIKDEKAKKTGVYKTHSLISVRDLISICAIKIEKTAVYIEKMKTLAENRKLYNMKELS